MLEWCRFDSWRSTVSSPRDAPWGPKALVGRVVILVGKVVRTRRNGRCRTGEGPISDYGEKRPARTAGGSTDSLNGTPGTSNSTGLYTLAVPRAERSCYRCAESTAASDQATLDPHASYASSYPPRRCASRSRKARKEERGSAGEHEYIKERMMKRQSDASCLSADQRTQSHRGLFLCLECERKACSEAVPLYPCSCVRCGSKPPARTLGPLWHASGEATHLDAPDCAQFQLPLRLTSYSPILNANAKATSSQGLLSQLIRVWADRSSRRRVCVERPQRYRNVGETGLVTTQMLQCCSVSFLVPVCFEGCLSIANLKYRQNLRPESNEETTLHPPTAHCSQCKRSGWQKFWN